MKKIFAIVFTIILISFIIVLLLKNVVYRKYRIVILELRLM